MTVFSVCIPFLKNEEYLRELLESLESIVELEMEVLVSQDAPVSNDLKQYFQERLAIIWLTGPKAGIAANWNHCIEQATGEYIVLFHADDKVCANYFDIILDLQRECPSSAAWFCGATVIDAQANKATSLIDRTKSALTPKPPTYCLQGDDGLAKLLLGCFIYCPTVCYRASVLKNHQFDERLQMVLDLDLYARLLMAGESISGANARGYMYRRHQQNQSQLLTNTANRFREEIDFYNSLAEHLPRLGWSFSARQAKLKIFVRLHLVYELVKSLLFLEVRKTILLSKLVLLRN